MSMLIRRDENNIDKVFRQKLHDAEEGVPMHLWEGIRSKTTRKRRFFYLWWLAAAMLITGAFCATYDFKNEPTKVQNPGEVIGSSEPSKSTSSVEPLNENPAVHGQTNAVESVPQESAVPVEVNQGDKIQQTKSAQTPNGLTKKGISLKRRNRDIQKRTNPSVSILAAKGSDVKSTGAFSALWESQLPTDVSGQIQNPDLGQQQNEESAISSPMTVHANQFLEEGILNDDHMPFMDTNSMRQITPARSRFQLGVYYAVSQPTRVGLSNTSESSYQEVFQRTHATVAQSFGVSVSALVWKNLSISLGLESFAFSESQEWKDSVPTSVQYADVDFVLSYPNNEVIPVIELVIDTLYQHEVHEVQQKQFNSYSSLNLPVLLGYGFGKKRWSFGLEAGPVFRFQRRNMGTWVVPHTGFAPPPDATVAGTPPGISSNEYISLTEYYQNWKTDLHLGLTARYAITGRFGVSFGAQYRQMLRKVNHDPSYGHRIILPGMNLGVNYRF